MQGLRPVKQGVLVAWLLVGALIPVMSYFGRNLQAFMNDQLAGGSPAPVMGGALLVTIGASLLWIMRRGRDSRRGLMRRLMRGLWHGTWLALVLLAITQLVPNPVEWVHFILFGLFGLMTTIALRPAAAIAVCLSVSAGDEIFQWLLPDRVGDLRDVLMNAVACLLGAAVAHLGRETA